MGESIIPFGASVSDIVTGFQGLVTGRAHYITGCDQYLVQPQCESGKVGQIPEGRWLDRNRLNQLSQSSIVEIPATTDPKKGAAGVAPVK